MPYVVEVNGKQVGGSYSSNAAARKKATDIWERFGEEAHVIRTGGTTMARRRRARKSSRKTSSKSAYRKGYKAGLRKARKARRSRRRR